MMSIQIAFKKSTFQNELEENTSNISNVSILNLCSKFRLHRSSTQWLGWACQLIKHIARQSWPIRWPWMWCASGTWTWAPNGTNITSQVELPKILQKVQDFLKYLSAQIPLWFAVLEFQHNRRRQVIVAISWQQATSTSLSCTVRLADCWKIKEVVQESARARHCRLFMLMMPPNSLLGRLCCLLLEGDTLLKSCQDSRSANRYQVNMVLGKFWICACIIQLAVQSRSRTWRWKHISVFHRPVNSHSHVSPSLNVARKLSNKHVYSSPPNRVIGDLKGFKNILK